MQELDLVLGRWLDDRWPHADATMREAFTTLLECEDDRIWSWLMQRERPDESLAAIINELRENATRSGRK